MLKVRLFILLALSLEGCVSHAPIERPAEVDTLRPQIVRFIAQPPTIHSGESATLRWSARNADSVLLEFAPEDLLTRPGLSSLGNFPPSGELEVHLSVTTAYVISCGPRTAVGCVAASLQVVVK